MRPVSPPLDKESSQIDFVEVFHIEYPISRRCPDTTFNNDWRGRVGNGKDSPLCQWNCFRRLLVLSMVPIDGFNIVTISLKRQCVFVMKAIMKFHHIYVYSQALQMFISMILNGSISSYSFKKIFLLQKFSNILFFF